MDLSARYPYRIQIVSQRPSTEDPPLKDVLTTEVVSTRAGIVAIAARFQKIYPRPGHRVLVYLLERSREPLPVDWESLQESGAGPQ
jgi:hypothetical protein